MSLVKKLAGETAIYGLSSILSRIVHYIVFTVYLTKRAFADELDNFGVYTEMYAYAAFLLILFTYRMETAYFRFGSKKASEPTVFSTAMLSIINTSVLFVVLLILFRNPIASGLLDYPDKSLYVIYFALIIGFDALAAIPFAKLRLDNRPIKFAVIKTANIVLTLLLVFFFLEVCPFLIDQGYTWFENVYQYDFRLDLVFISNLIASGLVLIFLLPEVLNIKFDFSWITWKKMMLYSLPLIVVGLAGVLNQSSAPTLLKYLLPHSLEENKEWMGIYGAAAKIAILMNLFTQAFNYAAEPFFFKQASKKDAKKVYADVAQAFALFASLIFLGILLYLDIVKVLVGRNYWVGLYVVPILLLSYWCLGIYYNFSIWYKVTDKTTVGALISLAGSIITFGLAFLLIKPFGIIGVAWGTLACYGTMATLGYLTGQRFYKILYPIGKMLSYILSALVVYFISEWIKPFLDHAYLRLGVNTMLLILYIALFYYLDKPKILAWMGRKANTKGGL
jgi:O-antigen/teichoic acid export membrane protein